MLRPFWQNRHYSASAYLATLLLSICQTSIAQSRGLIESFESLLNEDKKQYRSTVSKLKKNMISLDDIKKYPSASLSKHFLKSLLLYTENKYLRFASDDECKLLSLIETGLARTADGKNYHIPIVLKLDNGKTKEALATKQDYLNYVYSKKCLNNREMLALFAPKNISRTMKSLKLLTPKNEKECSEIHKNWTQNPFTPYICAISESIRKSTRIKANLGNPDYGLKQAKKIKKKYLKGEFFNKNVPPFHKEYFDSLCSHLYRPEKFCAPYLSKDVWSKINQKEEPSYKITYKCKHFLKKQNLTKKDIHLCVEKFNRDPRNCTTTKDNAFGALFPMPNCHTISESLLRSSLHTDYHDCPGDLDNPAVINVHRIFAHKKKLSLPSDELSCSAWAHHSLSQLSPRWPLKICYFDKISDKRECIPYVPKHIRRGDPLGEGDVVARILYRMAGTLEKNPCTIVSDKSYNTVLLKYKYGCFIVFDSQLCTTLHCEKKIFYDSKEVKGIEYTGANIFDYFANSFKNEKLSMHNVITDSLKMESQIIHNLTFLRIFFKKYSHAIAHGIGCAEDLLPSFFQKTSLGSCRPLTFIVDGIIDKKGKPYLSFRSSIDDVHSPRLIAWDQIFNGVSNYKTIHPLNSWTFYGLK